MSKKAAYVTCAAWLTIFLFSTTVVTARAGTNQTIIAETMMTTNLNTVVDQVHSNVSDYVREKADKLDVSLDELLTPKELERSRTFDRFFGDRRREDDEQRTRLKFVPKIVWSETDGVKAKLRFSLKLDLPRTENRIQLVADNLMEDEDALPAFSESGGRTAITERQEDTSIALRAKLGEIFKVRFTGDVGLKFRPEPVPKIKLRARLPWKMGNWQMRLTEALIWESKDGFGEKTSLDFERPLGPQSSIEFESAIVWSETSKGVDLGQSIGLSYFPDSGHTFGLKLGVKAHTEPSLEVDKYLVRFPLSRKTEKQWMRFIVEPGADFPVERDYKFSPLIIFKLELIFGELPKIL